MASRQSSRKTGARKGASRASSRKGASESFHVPGWLWGLVGVIAGFAGAQYFQEDAPPPRDEIASVVARKTDSVEQAGSTSDQRADEGQTSEEGGMPTFEFYTLLPESEVIAPGVDPSAPRPGTEGAVLEQHASRVADVEQTTTATAETPPPDAAESERRDSATSDSDRAESEGADNEAQDAIQRIVAQRSQQQGSAEGASSSGDSAAYMLQAASFQSQGDADGMQSRLENLGLDARISRVQTADNTTWYRVQAGPYQDNGELARARSLMQSDGIEPLQLQQR